MKITSKQTIYAAYVGYLTQAITINFSPLLFLTFEKSYGISIGKISLLIAISFFTQLMADSFVAKWERRLNIRAFAVGAHLAAALGMCGFAFLPEILPSSFAGLIIATVVAAAGGGIIEVVISPIVEACPTPEKSSAMSLLHSFYSWGLAAVVLLSTIFFNTVGIESWRILTCLWAIIPAIGAVAFIFVPIYELDTEEKTDRGALSLFKNKLFWVFFTVMFCSGASEMAMSQWASSFAESGLGVDKSTGDLLGPFAFAMLMGSARVFYGIQGGRIKLSRFITISAVLCVASYLLTSLSPYPLLSLIGCAVCGLSVGIMWPGSYSIAAENISTRGVRMFALLAIAGDLGCLAGPTLAGWLAELWQGNMKPAFLICTVFPLTIVILMLTTKKARKA